MSQKAELEELRRKVDALQAALNAERDRNKALIARLIAASRSSRMLWSVEREARRVRMALRSSVPFVIDSRGDEYEDAIDALDVALAKIPATIPSAM